jgi:hypothetical protein
VSTMVKFEDDGEHEQGQKFKWVEMHILWFK